MDNKQYIKKQLQQVELKIKKMHLHQNASEVSSQVYNKLILEKAILKKEFENISSCKILDSVKKFLRPNKEKLICDYFKQ